jgi:hypothetical protein
MVAAPRHLPLARSGMRNFMGHRNEISCHPGYIDKVYVLGDLCSRHDRPTGPGLPEHSQFLTPASDPCSIAPKHKPGKKNRKLLSDTVISFPILFLS